MLFGLKKGCDFIGKTCKSKKKFEEFCYNENDVSCSVDGVYGKNCDKSVLTGNCLLWQNFDLGCRS